MMLRFRMLWVVGVSCIAASHGMAHDLKVMPKRSAIAQGETAVISISWGHQLPLDGPLEAEALERYDLQAPSGSVTALQKSGLSLHTNKLSLHEEGVYEAIAIRKPSVFTVVIDQEGKHKHHRGPKTSVKAEDGQIDYAALSRQYAKTLITSGPRGDRLVPTQGLPLEIVPMEAPAQWRADRDLHFQVLFEGKPLANEELVVSVIGFQPTADANSDTDTDKGAFTNPTLKTNDQGIVTVKPSPPGTWVLRQRVKKPVVDEALRKEYDFESFTSTLVLDVLP